MKDLDDDVNITFGTYLPIHEYPDTVDLNMKVHEFKVRPQKLNVRWSSEPAEVYMFHKEWTDEFAESNGFSDFEEMERIEGLSKHVRN